MCIVSCSQTRDSILMILHEFLLCTEVVGSGAVTCKEKVASDSFSLVILEGMESDELEGNRSREGQRRSKGGMKTVG